MVDRIAWKTVHKISLRRSFALQRNAIHLVVNPGALDKSITTSVGFKFLLVSPLLLVTSYRNSTQPQPPCLLVKPWQTRFCCFESQCLALNSQSLVLQVPISGKSSLSMVQLPSLCFRSNYGNDQQFAIEKKPIEIVHVPIQNGDFPAGGPARRIRAAPSRRSLQHSSRPRASRAPRNLRRDGWSWGLQANNV